jgi:hypothetical protein
MTMTTDLYRYQFAEDVLIEEVEATIVLSLFAVESLHGEAQTRLDAQHHFDAQRRACIIDASTVVGRDFNRLFVGFLRREFGEDSFRVERLREQPAPEPAAI